MNVLFMTLVSFDSLQTRNLYSDLLREFAKNRHRVYVISPIEKRMGIDTHIVDEKAGTILRLQIGNIQKTNIIQKGIATIMIESTFKAAIKKYFPDVKFDLVLYSTPPITFVSAIEYVKKRDYAKTYLLLKDIFPQNAVDLGMMSKSGIKGLIYKYFRAKEKKLYEISDYIGCMSQANVDYVIKHNPEINPSIVEVCPNSIEVIDKSVSPDKRKSIRLKYNIPLDRKVLVYGGNLGKPQGIDFLIKCLESQRDNRDVFFLIVGDGTEYGKLDMFLSEHPKENVRLMKRLPKEDYDILVGACDVGMIFLDYRFTIPNFPSRLLSYMQAKIPVLACTDANTDIGKVVVDGSFGWWCESNDKNEFNKVIQDLDEEDCALLGDRAYKYLLKHYACSGSYEIILRHWQ